MQERTDGLVRETAERLNLHLVYLSKYSPDLNPIEFLWKDAKRKTSRYPHFDDVIEQVTDIAHQLLKERKMSYSNAWRRQFISINT